MAIPVVQLPLLNLSTHPFDLLLAGIGLRMMQLARTNKAFQALLVDRSFVMQIESRDGIARNFTIANGQVTMASGHAAKADFTLRFRDGNQAIKILTQGKPAAFMVGMQDGSVQMEGDFSLLMWFNQASKMIVPKVPKPVMEKAKPVIQHVQKLHSRIRPRRRA
ncbi:MAG: SCP-2 sterol transfer family protein [Gammaproteobacteria bacterium]|nr:SCP-2 sterol transfer family protein [Gammaproteobacteria bacterium]